MKKLTLLLLPLVALFMTSCATAYKEVERKVYTSFSDYRKYAEEGFLISPSPYTYNFDSVGELEITVYPAKTKKKQSNEVFEFYNEEVIEKEEIEYNELVAIAVAKAKEKGADGIVNFLITTECTATTYNLYTKKQSGGEIIC